jgi:hypothetical protein
MMEVVKLKKESHHYCWFGANVLRLVKEELENEIECEQRHSFKKTIDCCYLNADNEWITRTEMCCSD